MEYLVEILQITVGLFIDVVGLAMLIRAILSLIGTEESKLLEICYAISEPLVAPVRNVLNRVPGIMEIGIDFSFLATYMILLIIKYALLSAV